MSDHVTGAAHDGPTPSTDGRSNLARAVDELALSCPGLARGLGADCLPHTASLAEGLKHYGGPSGEWTAKFSLRLHWRNGMRVTAAWDEWNGKPAALQEIAAPALPAEDTVGPDEAVGRPAEKGNGAVDQPRLGGV